MRSLIRSVAASFAALALSSVTAGCGAAGGESGESSDQAQTEGTKGPLAVKLLQANVGNVDLRCLGVNEKLCYQDAEDRIATEIKKIDPDIVLLQEVLPFELCRKKTAWPSFHVCHEPGATPRAVRDQARRLLGDAYTIVCEPKNGWDCVAARSTLIDDIAPDPAGRRCRIGALCGSPDNHAGSRGLGISDYRVPTIDSAADAGFHVFGVDLTLKGKAIRLVSGHPQSGFGLFDTGGKGAARGEQLRRAFAGSSGHRVLLGGDMNMDPFAGTNDPSVEVWNRFVDTYDGGGTRSERAFHYHSGVVEGWRPPATTSYLAPLSNHTLDHVISNFASGKCTTRGGDLRIDRGRGMDHFALVCDLVLP